MDVIQDSKPPDKSRRTNIQPTTNVAELELLNASKTMPTKDKYIDMKPFSTPNIVFEKSSVVFPVNNFNNQIPIREEIYRKVSRKGKTLGKIKTNADKMLSSLKKKNPTAENNETNNISQLSNLFFFRG